jgi:hypothetical protein
VDTDENRPMAEREASTEIMMHLAEKYELSNFFYRSKQNLYIYFSLQAGILKFKNRRGILI